MLGDVVLGDVVRWFGGSGVSYADSIKSSKLRAGPATAVAKREHFVAAPPLSPATRHRGRSAARLGHRRPRQRIYRARLDEPRSGPQGRPLQRDFDPPGRVARTRPAACLDGIAADVRRVEEAVSGIPRHGLVRVTGFRLISGR
jgi:hypothetical protein